MNYLQKINKQNNVIVTGMRVNDQEQGSMEKTENSFGKELEVNVQVKSVITLGQKIRSIELEI